MKNLAVILLLLVSFGYSEIEDGKSGIPAIDTLQTYVWDVKTSRNSLGLALLCGIFPGGMQYYFKHPVKGAFMTGIEGILWFNSKYNRSIVKKRRIEEGHEFQDSIALYTEKLMNPALRDSFFVWQGARARHLNDLRKKNDAKIENEDGRRIETAWAIGLHLYSIFDGFGIWMHNNRRLTEKRSLGHAVLRAMVFPGWGQMYNDEWGKAGFLYMAGIGAVTAFISRQDVVEYYLNRKQVAVREGLTSEITDMEEKVRTWRKRRNQFAWGLLLIRAVIAKDRPDNPR
jgi:hypothetical protein